MTELVKAAAYILIFMFIVTALGNCVVTRQESSCSKENGVLIRSSNNSYVCVDKSALRKFGD